MKALIRLMYNRKSCSTAYFRMVVKEALARLTPIICCSTALFQMVVKDEKTNTPGIYSCSTAHFRMVVKERNIREIKLKVAVQYTFTW